MWGMTRHPDRLRFYLSFAIAVLTILIYLPALDYPFVNYDDNLYVTDNGRTQQGLTWDNVGWAFTTGYASNWHPLTWLSHMLDVTLFGLDSGWHHAVNIAIHAAAAALLFRVLAGMTGAVWPSAAVAGLFAWHPLHVESVAWIAERKDVLCAFFWIAAMGAYGRYAARPGVARYGLVAGLFALALMAKSMAVTLPCALLLLDVWPLDRLRLHEAGALRRGARLVAEKAPLFAMSAAASVAAYMTQRAGGSMNVGDTLDWPARVANALTGYGFYLRATFWPSELAVYYPHPRDAVSWAAAWTALAAILLITVIALSVVRQRPYLAAGWFWFLGVLVPVIGLVQVGGQAYACRYAYLPHIGLFMALSWSAAELVRDRRRMAGVVMAVALALCLWRTHEELKPWRSSHALFSRALAVTGSNSMTETALGNALIHMGRAEEALFHLDAAIAMTPGYVEAHINKGKALNFLGRRREERETYLLALTAAPENPKLHGNLGASYAREKAWAEAERHFRAAIAAEPTYGAAYGNLAFALLDQGKYGDAAAAFETALTYGAGREDLWLGLATARWRGGETSKARDAVERALRLAPESPEARALAAEMVDGGGGVGP